MEQQLNIESHTNIPTIRQVLQQIEQSHRTLGSVLDQLQVTPLEKEDDIEQKKMGIRKILKKIPDEEDLSRIWGLANNSWIPNYIKQIKRSDYQLIKTAQQNFKDLKPEQKIIYFIATQCNLPKISEEFMEPDPQNLASLSSYKDVAILKKQSVHKIQKNMISEHYFQDLYEQYEGKEFQGPEYLQKYAHLINICYYDSHNGEKQYEFVCLGEQKLKKLIQKFDCLILHLDAYYKYSDNDQPLLDYTSVRKKQKQKYKKEHQEFQITIEFNQDLPKSLTDPYNNLAKQFQQEVEKKPEFIVIGDFVYYSGSKQETQKLVTQKYGVSKESWFFREMEQVNIDDLRVIFGYPYVYSHLDGCDHIVIFKEARLFMGNDSVSSFQAPQKSNYPVRVFQSKMKRKKCEGCGDKFAVVVSLSDPLKKVQNLYLCKECHENLHYDKEGNIKYTGLKLIPYVHD